MSQVSTPPSPALRRTILLVISVLFLLPLAAMAEFTLRSTTGGYGFEHWAGLGELQDSRQYRALTRGLGNSLVLSALSLGLVLCVFAPTIIWVHLRFARLQRMLDLLTVLPIAIPAIALVVGFAPIYRILGRTLGSGEWTLFLAYGVLVLPFAYRAIAADLHGMDARVLSEAARSLGAGWPAVFIKVLIPGLRRGLLSASLLTVAIVMGEFTVSSLLSRDTFQTGLLQISQTDPYLAVLVSLLSLLIMFVLLALVSGMGSTRGRMAPARTPKQKKVSHAT
ncbi:ABC transporter permease [Paeniglutamicibacter gangotriensis]|uniref:Iron ABC transporter permease n=2 Tax=Paeniglutamicibacter gangotriensis TaxID=254787 RepID=M7MKK2_9MICC|nr:ABC transporter permease subunit [Paeniglutamicibacter gangotriensis]EMQ96842.1 iron ABC transporter permease [Paeniglutamicibacter gangotriensis Lz1y]KAA0977331.1 ABC transporter permease subunit [Paeniglutamicibacter gangotriensis]